jgi:hypothetical protein
LKLLIAYDGSACSDVAIVEFRYAGLPESATAVVLTVAESSMQVHTTGLTLAKALAGASWHNLPLYRGEFGVFAWEIEGPRNPHTIS